MDDKPVSISNAEFAGYEEEEIDRITAAESEKIEQSPVLPGRMAEIEAELGPGEWGEHWITVDDKGDRVYAKVYFGAGRTVALDADGRVVRDFTYA